MSQKQARFDPYQAVTDLILTQLERGTVPWRCPWRRSTGRPRNFHTGKPYQGVNVLLLGLSHFASPYWMTFRQVSARGGRIRKGEHGALVVKFGQFEKKVTAESGTEEKKRAFYLKGYRVFNAAQIEGIEFPEVPAASQTPTSQGIAAAEAIVEGMPKPPLIHKGLSDRACYSRIADAVQMPRLSAFSRAEDYHLTLFHELVHSTGHPSRLNRKTLVENDGFGGTVYSQEELVAEMGAAFLGMEADIVRDQHEQSAAYLKGWLDVLRAKEHRKWIVQAANQAGRATDFILNRNASSEPDAETAGEIVAA